MGLEKTADVIERHILKFDCPLKVVTDNQQSFVGVNLESVLQYKYDIEHKPITPLHPESNGIVERVIGTLKGKILDTIEDLGIDKLVGHYNNSLHSITEEILYFLYFGRP